MISPVCDVCAWRGSPSLDLKQAELDAREHRATHDEVTDVAWSIVFPTTDPNG